MSETRTTRLQTPESDNDRAGRVFYYAMCVLVLVVAGVQFVRLALIKSYSLDEFQYAHAAWLTARGHVVYRDFFECHLPLIYQILSPLFLFTADNPENMIYLRAGMTGIFALCALSAWFINKEYGFSASVAAPVFLSLVTPFSIFASDIRPDPLAFTLFITATACVFMKPGSDRLRGFVCGVLITAALWASQKALVYCAAFVPIFISDVVRRRNAQAGILGSPLALLFGAGMGLVPIVSYLFLTQSLDEMWHWCFGWAMIHQREYTRISWLDGMKPIFNSYPWLLMLALIGLGDSFRKVRISRAFATSPDSLLLLSVPSTFFSVILQRAPFPYSLVPFLGVTCIFGARGLAVLHRAITTRFGMFRSRSRQHLLGGGLLVLLTVVSLPAVEMRIRRNNSYQRHIQSEIGRLTHADDTCYDNAGSYITRPHSHFFYYTDYVLRKTIADTLAREVPASIIESETVLMIKDPRYSTLPDALKAFLDSNFQAYNDDIYLWGSRFISHADELTTSFVAVKSGEYFIMPSDIPASAVLEIDGKTLTGHRFHLERGSHSLRLQNYQGELFLLWLPRDGRTYEPKRNAKPHYVSVF